MLSEDTRDLERTQYPHPKLYNSIRSFIAIPYITNIILFRYAPHIPSYNHYLAVEE